MRQRTPVAKLRETRCSESDVLTPGQLAALTAKAGQIKALADALVADAAPPPPPPPPPAPPPPAVAATGAYRSTQPNLFADILATTPKVKGPGQYWVTPARAGISSAAAYSYNEGYPPGPSYEYVEKSTKWPWVNLGGDWINTAGVAQATTAPHFTFAANSTTSGTALYSVNALAGAQAAWTRGKWNAYILKAVGGTRSIVSQHHATIAGPVMNVTYADNTTGVLACIACVRMLTGTSYTQIGDDVAPISISVALEFEMPTQAVTAATIVVTIADHTATAATLNGYFANPPVNTNAVTMGVADAYTLDSGIGANASILFTQRYQDGAPLSDFVASTPYPLDPSDANYTLARWDPELFGTGPADTTKLPTAHLGTPIAGTNKWFHKQPYALNVTKVESAYSADGFSPAFPGIGALRVVVPKPAAADGGSVGYGTATGCDLITFFPKAVSGIVDDTYVRFMVRIAGSQKRLADTKMFRNDPSSLALYAIRRGKWGIGVQHWTSYGGNAQRGGNNLGHTNRLGFTYHPSDLTLMGVETRTHSFDMLPAKADMTWGDIGGMGGSLYPDRWYTVEVRQKLNTYLGGAVGTSPADGIMQVWIDGRLVSSQTGWKYRDGALDYVGTTPTSLGRLVPFRNMGPWGMMLNHYIGGNLAGDEDFVVFYTMIAAGTEYIGPARL